MAKQMGCEIKGRLDDYSFYHDRLHGYLARRTGGVTSKEYKTDQRYAGARDASSEFSLVSASGKLIRQVLDPFIRSVKDSTMVNRLNKELVALKQLDNKHARGERRPETMMADADANKWLRIFQFNEGVKLYDLLESSPGISMGFLDARHRVPTEVRCVKLRPSAFPEGATHARLTLVRNVIDFEKGCFETRASRMVLVARAGASRQPEVLVSKSCAGSGDPTQRGSGDPAQDAINRIPTKGLEGIEITCLQVVFFEERNGELIQLKGKVHSMGIIGISKSVRIKKVRIQSLQKHRCLRANLRFIPERYKQDKQEFLPNHPT